MKKILFALLALFLLSSTTVVFTSCDDEDPLEDLAGSLVGSMKVTIDNKTATFTGVGYFIENGTIYFGSGNMDGAVLVSKLDGTTPKKYTLGVVSEDILTALVRGELNIGRFNNILAFRTVEGEIYVVVAGTFNVTSIGNEMKGSFSGNAVTASYVEKLYNDGMNAAEILKVVTGSSAEVVKINCTGFTAKESSILKEKLSNFF